MRQQLDNIDAAFGADAAVTVVVGYKADEIVDRFHDRASFVYNTSYDQTNTSKSLLRALEESRKGGVLWMNGDVVFDPETLVRARSLVAADQSFVTVNTSKVSDEEVKYTVGAEGYIAQLSKTVSDGALGEAVGINYISGRDKASFVRNLKRCAAQDYFERGLELSIERDRILVEPMDISDMYAVEVDFPEDLVHANDVLGHLPQR
jgi:choline kinase